MNLRRAKSRRAFSLVELTIAIGITAFGGITVMGLLSVGLSTFRSAVDMSVGSQIVQQVVADVQQASFCKIQGASATMTTPGVTTPLPIRYFDDQGTALGTESAPPSNYSNVVYKVAVGVNVNASGNLATVVVDIVNKPGDTTINRDAATGGFVTEPTGIFSTSRYSFLVSKTQ